MWRRFLSVVAVFPLVSLALPSAQAQYRGDEYYNKGVQLSEAGRHREAIPYYTKAIEMDARNADAWGNRGWAWVELEEYGKALSDLNQAIRVDPTLGHPYGNRGRVWLHTEDYDRAIADLDQAIRFEPHADWYYDRGIAWNKKKEYDKAIADYTQAIRLDPKDADCYYDRALAWYDKKEYDKAIADYTQAIRLDPKDEDFYYERGVCWDQKGEYDKAIADYTQVIRLDPKYADAYNGLAWLQATCPDQRYRDGKEAFKNASKAYQLTGGKSWNDIDTLAAAYAENGAFKLAVEWQTKALDLAAKDKSATDEDKQEMRSRLDLYRQGKPYREELKKR